MGERVQETGDQEGGGRDDGVKQKSKGKQFNSQRVASGLFIPKESRKIK